MRLFHCQTQSSEIVLGFVADSSTATGLKWAAPSSGAMTLIKRASFSAVGGTSTTFDDVFSSTYGAYQVSIENLFASTAADDLELQLRYAGPTTQTTGYYGNVIGGSYINATVSNTNYGNVSRMLISIDSGASSGTGSGYFWVQGAKGDSESPSIFGSYMDGNAAQGGTFWSTNNTPRVYTGFLLKSSSSNITGTVSVYGLAKA